MWSQLDINADSILPVECKRELDDKKRESTPACLKTVGCGLSKKPSMANMDFRGDPSSSDLGIDWTWLLEPLPPMLQETHAWTEPAVPAPTYWKNYSPWAWGLRKVNRNSEGAWQLRFPWQNTICFSLLCENLSTQLDDCKSPNSRKTGSVPIYLCQCQFWEITLPGALMHGGREPNGRTPIMAAR